MVDFPVVPFALLNKETRGGVKRGNFSDDLWVLQAMISIKTHIPKSLVPFIHSFWYLEISDSIGAAYEEEIIPDGHLEIIFHLDAGPARLQSGSDEWRHEPRAFFAGQDLRSFRVRLKPGSAMYGVRFYPHTQALFFSFPAALTTDHPLPIEGVNAGTLWQHISDQPEITFANLEQFFAKKLAGLGQLPKPFRYVDASVREILRNRGNVKVDRLLKNTGISSRHLDSSFQRFVGVNPKTFCNIVKFNNFISYRKNNPLKSLTECALETNFYDQSHLIHLSKTITGKSPKSCLGQPDYINDFFVIT